MKNKKSFICRKCGTVVETKKDTVMCCGGKMMLVEDSESLDICTSPFTAEQTRISDDMEPCDDGRGEGLK